MAISCASVRGWPDLALMTDRMTDIRIDGERLWSRIVALGEIGAITRPGRRAGLCPPGPHRRRPAGPRPRHRLDGATSGSTVTVDAIGNVVATRPGTDPGAARRDDRLAHRHRRHRWALRRQPRGARRTRGDRDPGDARHRDAPADQRRLLHRRGRRPLRPGHARQPRVRRRHGPRGGARHHRRRRRRPTRRRAGAHRLCRAVAVPGGIGSARLRRAAHRAGPDPRGRGCDDRRRRRRPGHLVDRVDDHRTFGPCRYHSDATTPRSRLRRRGDHDVRA